MRRKVRQFSTVLLFLWGYSSLAAAPNNTTFQTRITTPSGQPLEASSVNFRFSILDAVGTCTLYVEDYNGINMSNSQGVVSFALGSGIKQFPVGAVAMFDVFNNSAASFPCQAGGSYIPSSVDRRQIVMQFNDGNGWQTLPQMAIYSVPFAAYATRAESLAGYSASDFLRTATLPVCTSGQALNYNGTTITCAGVSSADITTALGYTPLSQTKVTTITNASGDITLAPVASTGAVLVSSGTSSTGTTTGALVVTGGVGISGDVNTGGSISSDGTVAAKTSMYSPQLYGTTTPSGSILIDGTSSTTRGNVILAAAGGNVGIGTTTPPSRLLHVNGVRSGSGTISTTAAATTITGVGTAFTTELAVGDSIQISGDSRTVVAIADDTNLTVDMPYTSTQSTLAYMIHKQLLLNGGTTVFGENVSTRVHSSNLFGNVVPQYEFVSSSTQGWGDFTDLMVFRHRNTGTYGVSKQQSMAFLMKMGTESSSSDAGGGGGLIFETTSNFMNNPVLYLVNGNARRVAITNTGNVGIGTTTSPNSILQTYASGAKTSTYTGNSFSNVATSGTSSINKTGLDIQSTGTWNGTSAKNIGLNVNATGGTTNYAALFNGGSVGIGTTTPGAQLDITDTSTTTSAVIVPRAGNFTGTTINGMIRYNTTTTLFEFRQNGAWVNYTTVSDARLKTNVEPVVNGLELAQKLNPVFYDWDRRNPKTSGFENKHQLGFLAQEVEQVIPEVVNKGEDSYRSVDYGKIVAVAIAAIKELYDHVTNVRSDIEKLQAENVELKKRLDRLEENLKTK